MVDEAVNDLNMTISSDVVKHLNMGIDTEVQRMLIPLYEKIPFLSETFLGIPYANLLAASITFLFFLLLRRLFTSIVITFLLKLAEKSSFSYDDKIILALKEPIRLLFITIGIQLFISLTFIENSIINRIIESMVLYVVFWAIFKMVTEVLTDVIHEVSYRLSKDLSDELGNFIVAILKILVVGFGLGAILQVWGINVTALVASLGIGGLVFALAAKDTAANLFGSLSLLVDQSIRIGEWIKVNGVEGTVEYIGMRTTKIRAFDKSLITVPNNIVANKPIENFSRRGVRRIKMTIGVTYDTKGATVAKIVAEIKEMLQNHPRIAQDQTLLVNFDAFGDSSLNIFIYTFSDTAVWSEYLLIKEDVQLKIMEIVENNGSSFAFPSQSLYLESVPEKNML